MIRLASDRSLSGSSVMATISARVPPEVLDIKANFVGGLAHLIIGWANAESWFLSILSILLGGDEQAAFAVFFSHRNSLSRLELVTGMARERQVNQKLIDDLSILIRRFKELSRKRNFYAHAVYTFGEHDSITSATGVRFNAQDQAYRSETVLIDRRVNKEIRENFRGLQKLTDDLDDFAERLKADPAVRRLKRPPRPAAKHSVKASRRPL
jgi:hypothetical protein